MTTLRENIRLVGEEAHGRGKSYDDSRERNALREFLKEDSGFRKYISNYTGIDFKKGYKIIDDPLGKKKVDLGITQGYFDESGKTACLVEVDVFNKWLNRNSWPDNYSHFHVLERKLKYFIKNSLKYVTCTFSKNHDSIMTTTRDNIEMWLDKKGIEPVWIPAFERHDQILRIPKDCPNVKTFHRNNTSEPLKILEEGANILRFFN